MLGGLFWIVVPFMLCPVAMAAGGRETGSVQPTCLRGRVGKGGGGAQTGPRARGHKKEKHEERNRFNPHPVLFLNRDES